MTNVLISASAIIARSHAILDWGWRLKSLNPLILQNIEAEEVRYIPITGVYGLKGLDKGKLYYIMDGLERYPNDLQWLADEMKNWNVIRHPNREGKVNEK